ncbi:hypothetical protein P7D22_13150 [Lichenihabitans sp. Uapishka_5]|uniref:hypothetical protein n=1 Tax=Lichenihabitans sp. Uapishka_5 TaxID=3037302 RepID=UPI0029E81A5B|nr:hypothetical protein [Lichenihabitans sp. Uapishka_5]MDX7952121.1 hypothetical protein [Lichenihabitans sp. Uapishka_5]
MRIEDAEPGRLPGLLNLGSGKDFQPEAFNIDIDASWAPDAVLDLGAVDIPAEGIRLATERFGPVQLRPGQFDRIVANDVLEHVPNLMRLMTGCLDLLRLDGVFEISVPYDLSLGAWQDPTHVRGFNERSWLYYTDWFWYMGWGESRFTTDALRFVPSTVGEAMQARGVPEDEIIRTARAIDSMSVRLRKIALTPADRATWAHWRERRAAAAQRNRRPAAAALAAASPVADRLAAVAPSPAPAVPPPGPKAFAEPWSAGRNRYCVWIVSPKDYTHHHAFDDVATALSEAFAACGGSAPVVTHPSQWQGRIPIVLGPQLLSPNMSLILPPGTVLFNMEQVDRSSAWMSKTYVSLLGRHAVLDYSHRNAGALRQAGLGHAVVLPIGYVPALERIAPAPERDIDVLFYGSANTRRLQVLQALQAHGVVVAHAFDCYGAARDALIARAKIVLNLHYYEAAVFESVRVSLLLANRACVVTEGDPADPDLADLADGMAVCAYEDLVGRCRALLADAEARSALAARGHARIVARSQAVALLALFEPEADMAPIVRHPAIAAVA